jgi:hypothetical protein
MSNRTRSHDFISVRDMGIFRFTTGCRTTAGASQHSIRRIPGIRATTYIFTLKIATAVFGETLDNFQHSMWLIPES